MVLVVMTASLSFYVAPRVQPRPQILMRQDTPFEADALSAAFASPILRIGLDSALTKGTLKEAEKSVLSSWQDHLDEQHWQRVVVAVITAPVPERRLDEP